MGGSTLNTSDTRIEALTLQSSAYGAAITVAYGVTRLPGNLVWYGGFVAVPHTTSSGGKGGVKTQNTTYTYQASVLMGLCHGQISGITQVWRGKKQYSGGVTAAQLITALETYTLPYSGDMVYTPVHAATLSAVVLVLVDTQVTEQNGGPTTLAQGTDYTVSTSGVFTFLNDNYRGLAADITYQYTTGVVVQSAMEQLGLTFLNGAIGQATWSGLASFGAESIPYSGLAMVGGQAYDLGTGAQVENHSFEVVAPMAYHLGSSIPDVDPSLVLRDVLVNARYGAAFPPAQMDTWVAWSDYCVASGLWVSPAMTVQTKAAEVVNMMAKLTNTGPVWTSGRLRMVPYADAAVTGNGRTYTPNVTPVYDLDDECWQATSAVLQCSVKTPADRHNHVRVQYRDRANQYNPAIAEAKDQADIDTSGVRSADPYDAPWICDGATARQVAQLLMQRSLYVTNTYQATLPWHYAQLEPMDLVTLTDSSLGLAQTPARIIHIEEGSDGDLLVTFEDYPAGTSGAAIYPSQTPSGYKPNYNAAPGNVDAPFIFEAPAALAGSTGVQVYTAVRGSGTAWGGCQVWVSLDGTRYKQTGVIYGGARYGTLSAAVASGATALGVQGLGSAQLLSGSAAEAAALNTLCYVGGANPEYLAYQTATLTGTGAYTLTGLVRGAYGTASAAHTSGEPFARVDSGIAKSGELDISYIGKTIYFKFTSFNTTGGGQQSLADVSAYSYVVTGAMAALLPGWSGKALSLQASALTFQYPAAGGVNPSSITFTATRLGALTGTVAFSVLSGTATLTGSGDTRTLTPANMATDVLTVRASVTDGVATYTADVTVVKVRDGVSAISATLTPEAIVFPADSAGNVTSYATNTAVFKVMNGTADDTANWSLAIVSGSGVTSSLSGSTLTVSSMSPSIDASSVDVTATRTGFSAVTKRLYLSKAKAGASNVDFLIVQMFS